MLYNQRESKQLYIHLRSNCQCGNIFVKKSERIHVEVVLFTLTFYLKKFQGKNMTIGINVHPLWCQSCDRQDSGACSPTKKLIEWNCIYPVL